MNVLQPLSGTTLSQHIREMDDMMYCVDHFMDGCPEDLRLDTSASMAETSDEEFFRLLQLISEVPSTEMPNSTPLIARASYQAQQANLYVTVVG